MDQPGSQFSKPDLAGVEGWSVAETDGSGRTPLDRLYEDEQQRVRQIFENPLPELSDNDSEPDFLIGFSQYKWRQRSEYCAVLASVLDLHPSQIALSVAWSGRFKLKQLDGAHKVCGVRLLSKEPSVEEAQAGVLSMMMEEDEPPRRVADENDGSRKRVADPALITRAIDLINSRKIDTMLNTGMIYAAPKIAHTRVTVLDEHVQSALVQVRELVSRRRVVVLCSDVTKDAEQELHSLFAHQKELPLYINLDQLQNFPEVHTSPDFWATQEASDFQQSYLRAVLGDALGALASRKIDASSTSSDLPLIFVHGNLIGSVDHIKHIAKNFRKMEALLKRPNDMSYRNVH